MSNTKIETPSNVIEIKQIIDQFNYVNREYCREFTFDAEHYFLLYKKYNLEIFDFDVSWYNKMWSFTKMEYATHLAAAIYIINEIIVTSKRIKKPDIQTDYLKLLQKQSLNFGSYQTMLEAYETLVKALIYIVNNCVTAEEEAEVYMFLNVMMDLSTSEEDIKSHVQSFKNNMNVHSQTIQSKMSKMSILLNQYESKHQEFDQLLIKRQQFRKQYRHLGRNFMLAFIALSLVIYGLLGINEPSLRGIVVTIVLVVILGIFNLYKVLNLNEQVVAYDREYLISLEQEINGKLELITDNFDQLLIPEDHKIINSVKNVRNRENILFFFNWSLGCLYPLLIYKVILMFISKYSISLKMTRFK